MADVRALLRQERISRRLDNPYAKYSGSGQLACAICNLNVKSEALWDSHTRSSNHVAAVKAAGQQSTASSTSKKRKVDDEDEEEQRTGKRLRNGSIHMPTVEEEEDSGVLATDEPLPQKSQQDGKVSASGQKEELAIPSGDGVDEDEWAAFEREVATPPSTALGGLATISAAPLSAEEIAAQAREEQSLQRGRREVEIEDEKEEGQRRLEEEFEDMEALEKRMRDLKERRDAIRQGSSAAEERSGVGIEANDLATTGVVAEMNAGTGVDAAQSDEEKDEDVDDSDDPEADDLWRIGRS